MTLPEGAYITPEGWVVIGEEAYLPGDKLPAPKRRYRWLTDEQREHYHRDWMRAYRERQRVHPQSFAALHDLRCTGPTRRTGCQCKKIPLYRMED